MPGYIKLFIKIVVIITAFVLVFKEVDANDILGRLLKVDLAYVFASLLLLTLAQIISAFRMRFYFGYGGLNLNSRFSIGVYFTGMFFNTFLPGGIGGDGYKMFLFNKLFKFSKVKSLKFLLSERASGLFVLLILLGFFLYISETVRDFLPYAEFLILAVIVLAVFLYFSVTKFLFKENLRTTIIAFIYSFFIQIAGVAIVFCLCFGFGVEGNLSGYITLFIISSVLSVLPISIGGVGIREVVFLYGAGLFNIDAEIGISLAIIYFAVNLVCSSFGIFFWPKLNKWSLQN